VDPSFKACFPIQSAVQQDFGVSGEPELQTDLQGLECSEKHQPLPGQLVNHAKHLSV
jgi:hypothetical protein